MFLSFAVLALNYAINNPLIDRIIKGYVQKNITAKNDIKISYNRVSLTAIPPTVKIYGLSLKQKDDEKTTLTSNYVRADLSLKGLLLGKVRLSLLQVENTSLDVSKVNRYLHNNLKKNESNQQEAYSKETFVETVRFNNISLQGQEKIFDTSPFIIDTNLLDIEVSFKSWNDFSGNLRMKDFSVQDQYFSFIESGKLETSFEFSKGNINVKKTSIISNRLNFLGNIRFNNFLTESEKIINIEGDASGDISILSNFLDFENTRGPVSTKINATIKLPYKNGVPLIDIRGRSRSDNAFLYGYKLLNSVVDFRIDNDSIKFRSIRLMDKNQHLANGSGIFNFEKSGKYNFVIEPIDMSLTKLLEIVKVDFDIIGGNLTKGKVNLSGKSQPFNMDIYGPTNIKHLSLKPIRVWPSTKKLNYPDCDVNLKIAINNLQLDFSGTEGDCLTKNDNTLPQSPKSKIKIDGNILTSDRLNLNVKLKTEDLSDFGKFLGAPLSGKGNISTQIHGRDDQIKIEIDSKLVDLTVYDMQFGRVSNSLTYSTSEKSLLVKYARSSLADRSIIELSGSTIDLENDKINIHLSVNDAKDPQINSILTCFFPYLSTINTSVNSMESHIFIDLEDYKKSFFNAEIDLNDLFYSQRKILSRFKGKIRLDNKKFITKNARIYPTRDLPLKINTLIKNQDPNLNWDNLFSKKSYIEASFQTSSEIRPVVQSKEAKKLKSFDQSKIQELPYLGTYFASAKIGARLNLTGEMSGELFNPDGMIEFQTEKTHILGNLTTPMKGKLFFENKILNGNFRQLGSSLVSNLRIDLNNQSYSLFTRFADFDIKFLTPKIFNRDPRNYIYLSGQLDLSGKTNEFWQSGGSVELNDITGQYVLKSDSDEKVIDISNKEKFKLKLNNQILSGERLKLAFNDGFLSIDMGKTQLPNKLDITLDSSLNIKSLKSYFAPVEASRGEIIMNGKIFGDLNEPKLNFDFKTKQPLDVGLTFLRPPFRGLEFEIIYSDGIITFKRFTTRKGQGDVTISGDLNIRNASKRNAYINIKNASFNFDLPVIKKTEAIIDGKLILNRNGSPFELKGKIDVTKAIANKNIFWQSEITNTPGSSTITNESEEREILVKYDIEVVSQNSIYVNNKLLNLVMGHNLRLEGNNSKPILTGLLDINSGKIDYKKDYNITRGMITFDDRQKIDPKLDLSANAQISSHKVTVDVRGRPSDPKVELSIDPPTREDGTPLSQLDILVLMANGKLPDTNQSEVTNYSIGYEAINAAMRSFDDIFAGILDNTGQKFIKKIYLDIYPTEEGLPQLRANAPIDFSENLNLLIQGDPEQMGIKAEYDLEESISASINYYKKNNEDTTLEKETDNIDATIDLRFRFLFP